MMTITERYDAGNGNSVVRLERPKSPSPDFDGVLDDNAKGFAQLVIREKWHTWERLFTRAGGWHGSGGQQKAGPMRVAAYNCGKPYNYLLANQFRIR